MFLYAKRFSICSFQMHDATFKSIIVCEKPTKGLIATLVSWKQSKTVQREVDARFVYCPNISTRDRSKFEKRNGWPPKAPSILPAMITASLLGYTLSILADIIGFSLLTSRLPYPKVQIYFPRLALANSMIKILNIWKFLSICDTQKCARLLERNSDVQLGKNSAT